MELEIFPKEDLIYKLDEDEYSLFCHCTGLMGAAEKKKGRSYLTRDLMLGILREYGKAMRLFSGYLVKQCGGEKKIMSFLLQSLWNSLVLRLDDFLLHDEKTAKEMKEKAVSRIVCDNRNATVQIEALSTQLAGIHKEYDEKIKLLEQRIADV